jgi:hypothetical protein
MTDPTASPPPSPDFGASQPAFSPAEPLVFGATPMPDPVQPGWTAPQTSPAYEPATAAAPTADPYAQVPAGWPVGQPGYPGYPGYPAYPGYPGYPQQRPTNGMAIASMVVAIVGILTVTCYGLPALIIGPIGAILGHISRRKIKQNGEAGEGMALAGVIVGWIATALGLIVVAVIAFFIIYAVNDPSFNDPYYESDYDTY